MQCADGRGCAACQCSICLQLKPAFPCQSLNALLFGGTISAIFYFLTYHPVATGRFADGDTSTLQGVTETTPWITCLAPVPCRLRGWGQDFGRFFVTYCLCGPACNLPTTCTYRDLKASSVLPDIHKLPRSGTGLPTTPHDI